MSQPLIILDRDGVINHDSDDYIRSPEDWLPVDGSAEAIARLNQAGYKIGVATNQSGLSRGFFNSDMLDSIHEKMFAYLATYHATIHQLEYCPDHPKQPGPDRKPAPGMVIRILNDLDARPEDTWFVGDSLSDVQCALNAGCKPALVLTGKGQKTLAKVEFQALGTVPVFRDLADFTEALLTEI